MKMFSIFQRKIRLLLFLGLLSVTNQFITIPQGTPQRQTQITLYTEDNTELIHYNDSYALVIGNGAYPVQNGWQPLPEAVNDAKEVAEVLERHGFNVTLKTDITKTEFDEAFSDFIYTSGQASENRLLFYYTGHGHTTQSVIGEDFGYLVMLDTPTPKDKRKFALYSVDMVKFVSDSKKIHAKHVLFMFDSRFSGTILNLQNQVTPFDITERIGNPVRQFITAGRADEPVPSRSVFKKAFLNLLEGRVEEPLPDGYLTGTELADYLCRTVPALPGGQHPQHGKILDPQLNKGDFVFVLPQNRHPQRNAVELETMATLRITSVPEGATVYIDGVAVGTTPLQAYQMDTGIRLERPVNVGLQLSGYKSRVQKVTLQGGQQFSWDAFMEQNVEHSIPPIPESDPLQFEMTDDVQIENEPASNEEIPLSSPNMPQTILGEDTAPMVLIPAGEFQMGSGPGTIGNAATRPMHVVYVDAFYIDKYEVTVGQYNQFVRATNYTPLSDWVYRYSRTDAHPVVGVSWQDARAYAKWAGKRLPTEAEWEKAARGGLIQKNHAWGDTAVDGTQCNFADKNLRIIWNRERDPEDNWADENLDDGHAYTAPIGSYPPNGYGIYDMEGNVWEWCFDAYDENFYANSAYENPIAGIVVRDGANNAVAVNKLRVIRGSSWYDGTLSVWIAGRLGQSPEHRVISVGFRCVKSATLADIK
jgi:formylglycine-generating enzyme required for sulfatase activity